MLLEFLFVLFIQEHYSYKKVNIKCDRVNHKNDTEYGVMGPIRASEF